MLVTVSKRRVDLVRASDTVAHLGGDEFVLVIESIAEREQISVLGHKLVALLAEPITLDSGQVVSLGAVSGLRLVPQRRRQSKDILEVADQAMYFCKTSGLMPFS